jgi:hypothetical protein
MLVALVATTALASPAWTQTPAADPSTRLRSVLPEAVADRVLATIAAARARGLPAQALEHRALEMVAKGASAADVERRTSLRAQALADANDAFGRGGRKAPSSDELDAGADAMMRGVDGSAVSALAKETPSGRSLAMPLFVVTSLLDRGLPADSALARVAERLRERASDRELAGENGPREGSERGRSVEAPGRSGSRGHAPTDVGRDAGRAGGKPDGVGVPSNPGGGKGSASANGNAGGNGKGRGKGRKP